MEKFYSVNVKDGITIFKRILKTQEDLDKEYKIGKEEQEWYISGTGVKVGTVYHSNPAYCKNIVVTPVEDEKGVKLVSYDLVIYDTIFTKVDEKMTKIWKGLKRVTVPTGCYNLIMTKRVWRTERKTIYSNKVEYDSAECNPVVIKE